MNKESLLYKEYKEMIDKMIGKIYNIECITDRDVLYVVNSFGKRDIKDMPSYKRYKNLRLENITGFCGSQLYITKESGGINTHSNKLHYFNLSSK